MSKQGASPGIHPLSLAYLSLAWTAGIFLVRWFQVPMAYLPGSLVPLALWPFFRARRSMLIVVSVAILVFLGGNLRAASAMERAGGLEWYFGGLVTVTGTVEDEPDPRGNYVMLRLDVSKVREEGRWSEATGRVLIRAGPYPSYRKGDWLTATGKISPASGSTGTGAPLMAYPRIELERAARGPLSWARAARDRLSSSLSLALPEPQAAIGKAMLLGERTSIPRDLNVAFARTGTMHTLAISGWNLTIVAGVLLAVALRVLGKRRFIYVWVVMAGLWGYAVLTGMYAPVLRAAVMATIFLLAVYFGRQGSAFVALSVAAAAMLAFQPELIRSVSFQLSFVSMAGLSLLSPVIREILERAGAPLVRNQDYLGPTSEFVLETVSVTLAATIATLPLLAYYFGMVSVVSVAANLAVFPAIPFIMLTSGMAAIAGLLSSGAAWFFGWLAAPFLSYMIGAVRLFDKFPLASWTTGTFSPWWILAYYAVLGSLVMVLKRSPSRDITGSKIIGSHHGPGSPWYITVTKLSALVLVPASMYIWSAVPWTAGDRLKVDFLDVGNGDAILITTPHGREVLVDGGPDPEGIIVDLGTAMPKGRNKIDLVVLTHPHADHLTGLIPVLQRFEVGAVLERAAPYGSATYKEWRETITRRGIPLIVAEQGQTIMLDEGVQMKVLYAGSPDTAGDPDQDGIVFMLYYGTVNFLFTGDVVEAVERKLAQQRGLPAAIVLKAAHHGSATSSGPEFLAVARPRLAVVSVGSVNTQGLPSPAVMSRIERQVGTGHSFSTATSGMVSVSTDGKKVWVRTER
ncbi:MAG: ComEC/Rec2 family competence protein [Chloroflexi bacterium]|nr:ComEC/Rec2 family competence protein [Chloroflexota bacterium]